MKYKTGEKGNVATPKDISNVEYSMERKYVLMTRKHGSKTKPMFWGHLTEDDSSRSFSGYTRYPLLAERYSMDEIVDEFKNETDLLRVLPIKHGVNTIRKYSTVKWVDQKSNSEDIFVTPIEDAMAYGI